MSNRTIFNVNGDSRVINPRNGSSMFVDLSSNQIIYGNKTFVTGVTISGSITASSLNLGSGTITSGPITSGDIQCTSLVSSGAITGTQLTTSGGRQLKSIFTTVSLTLGLDDHFVNVFISSNNIIITLPSSPINGQEYFIKCDYKSIPYVGTLTTGNSIQIRNNIGTTYTSCNLIRGSYIHLIYQSTGGYWSEIAGNVSGFLTEGSISTTGAINGTYINSSILTANDINPYSGAYINSTGIWYYKSGSNVNIILDPNTTTGNRLTIYGISAGTKNLFYSVGNVLGLYNSSTSQNIWSINDIGSLSCGTITGTTISASTLLKTNAIEPYSGTTINVNSNLNLLVSSGINRIKFFPAVSSSAVNNILEIYKVGDNFPTSGFLSFNNTGLLNYTINNVIKWSITDIGEITAIYLSVGSGPVYCGSLSSGSGTITTTGAISCGSLSVTNNITGGGLNLSSGNITCGQITATGNVVSTTSIYAYVIYPYDTSTNVVTCAGIWNHIASNGTPMIVLNPTTTSGDRLLIKTLVNSQEYLLFNTSGQLLYFDGVTSSVKWSLNSNGSIAGSSLNVNSGTITCGNISGNRLTTTGGVQLKSVFTTTSLTLGLDDHFVNIYISSNNITVTLPASPINGQEYFIRCDFKSPSYIGTISTGSSIQIRSNAGTIYTSNSNIVVGSYIHLIYQATAGYWCEIAGNISGFLTQGSITGGVITGTSISVGSGGIVGASLNVGTGSISGGSLVIGTGGITTTGSINCVGITSTGNVVSTTNTYLNVIQPYSTSTNTVTCGGTWNFVNSAGTPTIILTPSTGVITCGNINCGVINSGSNSISTTGALNATYVNSSILTANDINPYSGAYINSTGIWYYKLGANVNIILNANTTSGNRLQIYGTSAGSKFLSYNTSDDLAVSTIWSINGTSGNLSTIGTISGTTITGTTGILTNNINQISGASINTNAEWKFNSDVVLNNTGYAIYSDLNYAKTLTDSNTYRNSIKKNTLFTSTSIGSIELSSKYISFVNPYQTLSTLSKYFFINPISDGNVGFNINNISGAFLQTTHATSLLYTNWNFAADNLMANTLTDSNSYRNTIKMNSLITSATKGTIEMRSEYISFVNPYHTISNSSQYFFIKTHTDGNVEFYINGFGSGFLETNHLTSYVVINWNLFVSGGAVFTGGIGNQGLLTTSTLTVTDTNNSAAIYVPYGGIHLANNNYLYGRIRFGDANYAYIAEYDTSDSDRLYLFGSSGIYCNILPVVVSDIRVKENIEDFVIENPLEIIEKIRLVKYNRIDNPSKKKVLGYIAQEILEIFPIAVEIDNIIVKKDDETVLFKQNEDGIDTEEPEREERLALNYHYMSMLNTEAIRELNNKVDNQQEILNTQQETIDKQQKILDTQEDMLNIQLNMIKNLMDRLESVPFITH